MRGVEFRCQVDDGKGDEMCGACSMDVGDEKFIEDLVQKSGGNTLLGTPRRR
jgi:hypothetical protein